MDEATRRPEEAKRILIADPGGETAKLLKEKSAELGAEVESFEQAALLALKAARGGADLVVICRPDSLAPLERLRNDPHTRHIPVLLSASTFKDQEHLLLAVVGADQIVDYPPEEEILLSWVRNALKRDFRRDAGQPFAEAKLREPGEARWPGRVSWVSGNKVRFETDLLVSEGDEFPIEGPLFSALGAAQAPARVLSRTRDDVFYNHDLRTLLEVRLPAGKPSLSDFARSYVQGIAPHKLKIAVVSRRGAALANFADAIDNTMYAVRWVPEIRDLASMLAHMKPALMVVDPENPDLADPMKAGALARAVKDGLRALPLSPPREARFWDRLGPGCPERNVPPLQQGSGWNELLETWAVPQNTVSDPSRVYMRRDHPFSHARLVTPCTLTSLTEAGGSVEVETALAEGARARIEIPALTAARVLPLHGRALRASRKGERAAMVWMGVGNEDEQKRLRFFVHETIMAIRRRELENT